MTKPNIIAQAEAISAVAITNAEFAASSALGAPMRDAAAEKDAADELTRMTADLVDLATASATTADEDHDRGVVEGCRLSDRLNEQQSLTKDVVAAKLQQTNAELTVRLEQQVTERKHAAQEATRAENALSKQIEKHCEHEEHVAKQTLESMDDVKWGFEELTRTESEETEKTRSEFEARLQEQSVQRLDHFSGARTKALTLERQPTRLQNPLDYIWGKPS